MGSGSDDVLERYGEADERGRLDSPLGVVEFERSVEILAEHMPPAPAVVADIGGGPGRHTLWLAEHGYPVRHRDIVPTDAVAAARPALPPAGASRPAARTERGSPGR